MNSEVFFRLDTFQAQLNINYASVAEAAKIDHSLRVKRKALVCLVFTDLTPNGFDIVVVLFSRSFDKRVN